MEVVDIGSMRWLRNGIADAKLTNLQIYRDYFSFTLLSTSNQIKVKYAFRRISEKIEVANTFEKRRSLEKDRKVFGFFTANKALIQTNDIFARSDYDVNKFITRFHPDKKITIYYTPLHSRMGEANW